jgi:3-hydroxybutyryl-CoA dehydratase
MRHATVGDTFTAVRECDTYRPVYYAAASGDFNPIHLDDAVAQMAGFEGRILHGLCTFGWAVDAFAQYLGSSHLVKKAQARFSKPVRVDDVISFAGLVTQVTDTSITATVSAKNQRGEEVLKAVELVGARQ